MLFYTIGQWRVFLALLLAGVAAGMWYGLFSHVARLIQSGPWLNAVCDVLIAAGIWLIVGTGLLVACYGEVRAYALIAAALGFAVERFTLGAIANALLRRASRYGASALAFLRRRTFIKKIFQ